MYCRGCGATLVTAASFCERCGLPVVVTGLVTKTGPRLVLDQDRTEVLVDQGPTQPVPPLEPQPEPEPLTEQRAETRAETRASLEIPSVLLVLIAFAMILSALVGAAGLYAGVYRPWRDREAIVARLETAAADQRFFEPPGDCAYDLYQQAKGAGVDADTMARVERGLVERLSARPAAMLEAIRDPLGSDPEADAWAEAQRALRWASTLAPNDPAIAARAEYCGGRALYRRGDKNAAIAAWTRAAELDTSWALPASSIGLVLNEQRQFGRARTFLLEAVRRDPEWAVPCNSLGTSYFLEDNLDEAEPWYRKAAELAPAWPRPRSWLGDIAMRRGDRAAAAEQYRAALELLPAEAPAVERTRLQKKLDTAAGTQGQAAQR